MINPARDRRNEDISSGATKNNIAALHCPDVDVWSVDCNVRDVQTEPVLQMINYNSVFPFPGFTVMICLNVNLFLIKNLSSPKLTLILY